MCKSNRRQFFLKPNQQQQLDIADQPPTEQEQQQQPDFHQFSRFNSGERILSPSKLQSTPSHFLPHQGSPFRDDDDDVEEDDERPTDYSLKFQGGRSSLIKCFDNEL